METKKRKLFLALIISIFIINFVFAIETEIKIKTLPNHEVQLTTHKSNTADFVIINQFKDNSDEYGDITFISSCDEETFDLIIYLKKDNEKVLANNFTNPYKEFNLIVGEPIYIELAPFWFEFIETPTNEAEEEIIPNETEVVEEIVPNETKEIIEEENKVGITGSAVYGEEPLSKKTIYYSIMIIILLTISLVIFAIIKKSRLPNKKSFSKENAQQILGDVEKEQKKKKQIMKDAQKKMKEIEEDMEKLRDGD